MQEHRLIVHSRVERDEHGNVTIRIPMDFASSAGSRAEDIVRVEGDECSGKFTITRVPIEPRARYDFHEVVREVIVEKRALLDRLAAYDRGEEP